MTTFMLPGVPGTLQWRTQPQDWSVDNHNHLTIVAGERTDLFIDPAGDSTQDNAPAALFTLSDNFCLSARVTVEFQSAFDAGVLLVREREDLWAKLCFEYSPQQQPMIVSVVTRGVSDDCNGAVITANSVYLRVARTAQTFTFHYSQDGRYWHLVRYFALGPLVRLQMGFSAQSPTGQRCAVTFSDIRYQLGGLQDIRNGE